MQSRLWSWVGVPVLLAVMAPASLLAAPPSSQGKTAVNLSVSGDDGLTQVFVASLQTNLAASGKYELVPYGLQSLQLVIPGHLYWKKVGGRTNFHYLIVLVGRESRYLGAVDGSCWLDEIDSCSKSIVTDVARGGVSR